MKRMNKVLSLFIAVLMIISIIPLNSLDNILIARAYTTVNTGNSSIDTYLNKALAQEGKSRDSFGINTAWCAYFTWWCANQTGLSDCFQSRSHTMTGDEIEMDITNHGGKAYYFWDDMYSQSDRDRYNLTKASRTSFEPKPGDIVVFRTSSDSSGNNRIYRWAHVGIVYEVTSSDIYVVHGNWGNKVVVGTKFSRSSSVYYSGVYWTIASYIRPNYPNSEIIINKSNSKIDINSCTIPANINQGTTFEALSGTISTNDSDGLSGAYVTIKDGNGNIVQSAFKALGVTIGTTRLLKKVNSIGFKDLCNSGSKIDFSKLGSGIYKIQIAVACSFNVRNLLNLSEYMKSEYFLKSDSYEFTVSGSGKTAKKASSRSSSGRTLKYDKNGNSYYTVSCVLGGVAAGNYSSGGYGSGNTYYNAGSSYSLGSYTVTAKSGLNTRQSPSATSRKLSGLKYGTTVTVTATDGNWGYVDGYGWICLDYTSYNGSVTSSYNQDVYYETGNYIVSTSSGLNCRKGPGTGYAKKAALKNGITFSVTETSGAWGYSPEYDGWLCLQYARYVSALTPVLAVPGGPVVTTNSSSEIAVGDIITVNWTPVEYADHYTAQLINANNGSVVETKENLTSYTAAFTTPYAGKFNVTVIAGNSQHTGATGGVYGIEAKNPSTVTFKDWDGKVLSTQKVAYGKNATAPATPTRTGYTFKEWSDSLNAIRSDKTITAVYTRSSYTVRFLDHDGVVVDTQSVLYADAATEPEYTAPTGYSFVKWDKDFSCITENTDVTAVVSWTSQYPLEIQATSNVVRNNTTYISTAIVNNSPNAVSNAKLILALKTAENKQLAYVESENFTMAAGAKKTVNLSVEYDGASTVGNLFVVKDNDQRIPQSNQLVVSVDQGTAWSQWSTNTPPSDAIQTQSRTEYRYRDKEYKTSNSSTLSGYTLRTDVTNPTYSSWGSWSSWQDSAVSSNNLRDVGTQTVYIYYHYGVLKNDGTRVCIPITWQEYNQAGSWNHPGVSHDYHEITINYTLNPGETYTYFGTDYQGYTGYNCSCVNDGSGTLKDDYWFYKGSKTQYRYRTRTATYYFEKWGSWSDWGTTKYTSSNSRDVQTRTTYRYVSNIPANIEDTTGQSRTISGSVGRTYANKHAIISITSSDGVTQFIGQTQLDASGNYSYTFKLKNEPTADSGDYKVSLSIEGTNAAIELDPILAPIPTYTVTFKDWDGTILSTQEVTKGESADIPTAPEHEGYKFVKWNKSATNVTEDMTVTAVYAVKSFGVVFLDDLNETSEIRTFNYGDVLETPEVTALEGYTFIGWDAVIDGVTTVSENMVVNAVYEKNTYTVTYLDHNDNVIDTVTVEYGDAPIAPAADDSGNITVYGWNPDGDTVYVTGDTTVRTAFDYNEYVETPSVNVETGTYSTAQTVTIDCSTDGATIYYTLDGTDPLSYLSDSANNSGAAHAPSRKGITKAPPIPDDEPHIYTGPFSLDSSAELVVAAVKDEMGDSGRSESVLAINTPTTEIEKHLVTLHLELDEYECSFLVEGGAKIPNNEWYNSYFGYTLNGTFLDEQRTVPVDLDSYVVTQSVDIYYDWTPNVYTVTFLAADGSELDTQQVEYLQDATAPTWPEIEGKTFSGWDNVFTSVSSDLIVKATYVDNADLTMVSFDKAELTLKEGATASIVATVSLGNESSNAQLIWESSDEEVAIVDDNGTVTAISDGTAKIYAVSEDSGFSASCEVTVEPADACKYGHTPEVVPGYPATCTEDGLTGGSYCSVCGTVLEEQQAIPAIGHHDYNDDGLCDNCGIKIGDSGGTQNSNCVCGKYHTGPLAGLIKFFHKIIYFFKNLFK